MRYLLVLLIIFTNPAFSQTEGYAEKNGVKIFYRTYGSGKPLLIINGGPGMNSDGFVPLAQQLSKEHQTILFDQRGTGKSLLEKIDGSSITMDLMIADMEALREKLKIDQWIVLGHSFGGMLASYYTSVYPKRVEKLILSSSGGIDLELTTYAANNINAKLSAAERRQLSIWNQKIAGGDTSHFARLQRGMALAPAYLYDRQFIPVIAERLTQGNSLINGIVWNDLNRIGFDCKEKLATFTKPVLVIQGKQDIIEEKTALKAMHVFKNARLVLLDHSVHYGWLDNAPAFFSAIEKFLK